MEEEQQVAGTSPEAKRLKVAHDRIRCLVFLDLETTGVNVVRDEIVQVYCEVWRLNERFEMLGEEKGTFKCYVMPHRSISEGASKVNGLHKIMTADGKDMLVKNMKYEVKTATPSQFITTFKEFLSETMDRSDKVYFCAFNGYSFDFPLLYNVWKDNGGMKSFTTFLQLFQKKFYFMDLMHASSAVLGGNKRKQEDVFYKLFSTVYPAHDAEEDVKAMVKIYNELVTKYSTLTLPYLLKLQPFKDNTHTKGGIAFLNRLQ